MSNRLFVATTKGLFTVERGAEAGDRWAITNTSFLGDKVSNVLPDHRDGTIYAALAHGHFGVKMHRSGDGGRSWDEVATPAYPEKPAGLVEKDQWGKELAWSMKFAWTLVAGHASDPGTLWCGSIPGGLFRSDDRGDSWVLNRPLWDDERRSKWFGGGMDLPGIHSICVDPRDARHLTLGVSCGGVWVTRDAGASWTLSAKGMLATFMPPEQQANENAQDPHLVVSCESEPDVLWAQHHCGIWKSTDGAANWVQVKAAGPSTFGFAVAVHPHDAATAWFVPAVSDQLRVPVEGKVVVTRTRDGGKSFDVLRNGLPQEHAYDLTYRHALDVDESGDRLAFGSTTGSLWVTEDQGDSWRTVSKHLPPILAVRFLRA